MDGKPGKEIDIIHLFNLLLKASELLKVKQQFPLVHKRPIEPMLLATLLHLTA